VADPAQEMNVIIIVVVAQIIHDTIDVTSIVTTTIVAHDDIIIKRIDIKTNILFICQCKAWYSLYEKYEKTNETWCQLKENGEQK